jgi:hypothetical protein
MDKATIMKVLMGSESARDQQVSIGPSQVKGCARQVWSQINNVPKTNLETLRMASQLGSDLHDAYERRLNRIDPFRYQTELEVEWNGLMGHVDCYDTVDMEVIDWKTTTKKKKSRFPSEQQRMQVQLYGYLLSRNGYGVNSVTLVSICRDGNETDVQVHSEAYDEAVALEGVMWLDEVREMKEPPVGERNARYFCRDYCSYYDKSAQVGCSGAP